MTRLAPDPLVMRAARRPREPAVCSRTVAWTRAQLLDASNGLALSLANEGVGEGSRVAALLADDLPAVVLIEALRRLGAVFVPLNRRAASPELKYQLGQVRAEALIHDEGRAGLASTVAGGGPTLHRVEALLAAAPCAGPPKLRDEVDLDATAAIVFTSGTAGRPKGAMLTHGNLGASAHAWSAVLRPRRGDRWLACLPFFHVAGLAIATRASRWGVELEVEPGFDVSAVSAAIDGGVSHLSLVPPQLSALLEARGERDVAPSLRAILLGGGPIPVELLERARAAGYPVLTTYGMTETGSGVAVGGADEATRADPTALRALPGVSLRIEPASTTGGSGDVQVRGEMVFAGYVDEPAATARALQGGWLHSGDVGTLDADGLLRIVDRRDDLIISGGENIAPAEVELVLLAHPDVDEAAVVALPHERWGAVPIAAVVLRAGSAPSDEELLAHCHGRLAAFKVPARIVRLEALPRTDSGKVPRHLLRERLSGGMS